MSVDPVSTNRFAFVPLITAATNNPFYEVTIEGGGVRLLSLLLVSLTLECPNSGSASPRAPESAVGRFPNQAYSYDPVCCTLVRNAPSSDNCNKLFPFDSLHRQVPLA